MDHFFVRLIPEGFYDYEETEELPAHDLILRPLLRSAKECYVYGLNKDTELLHKCTDILSFTRNKYQLDLKKEVIRGYERFWNATGWERGSILLFLELETLKELNIFTYCYDPGTFDNPNTGESIAAIRFCKGVISKEKKVGLCFSASNGIEWMKVYADKDSLKELYKCAKVQSLSSNSDSIYQVKKKRRNLPK
ncbi:hypothetical protein M3611_25310 [Priestia megaterium]|uniref:hypothetical protein n=1 Tax=Priestia megaterium TaxID=1404 RepID=UPI002041415F|nr:hypothetical protein [Priestia megaterium]MCM3155335.1 hypothetical protein [Priestia megaterium]